MATERYIVWNFYCCIEKYSTHSLCSLLKYFSILEKKFFICALHCNILYVHSPKYWSMNPLAAPAPAVAALAPTWSPFSSGFMAGNFCCSIRTICVQHSFASCTYHWQRQINWAVSLKWHVISFHPFHGNKCAPMIPKKVDTIHMHA